MAGENLDYIRPAGHKSLTEYIMLAFLCSS